jgi:hypothetical protein
MAAFWLPVRDGKWCGLRAASWLLLRNALAWAISRCIRRFRGMMPPRQEAPVASDACVTAGVAVPLVVGIVPVCGERKGNEK